MTAGGSSPRLWRDRLSLKPGSTVRHGESLYVITDTVDLNTVRAQPADGGPSKFLNVHELKPIGAEPKKIVDVEDITENDWRIAGERFEAIKPLLDLSARTRAEVEARARETGVSTPTLYRWLTCYLDFPAIVSLVPGRRGWREKKGRLRADVEAVIDDVIQKYFLTPQRRSATKTIAEVRRRCRDSGLPVPSGSTVHARLRRIPEPERMRRQGKSRQARDRFYPVPGTFPGADYPLAVVQIDHTPVDLILVDDTHRLPIGRPWITVAIDVFSRMVCGYYVSLDPPSGISVAMCLSHAMLPKEPWLLEHKVEADWPVWGLPKIVHMDNGSDFRAESLAASLRGQGIDGIFRPVKVPRYGGHIERLLGTLMKEIHDLPGTTFSSIKERDGYDSEKHAVLTLGEFERWLVTLICNVYHRRLHRGINMPPLRKWDQGIFGGEGTLGIGLPDVPADRERLVLDFMPSFERTIQPSGVTFNGLRYYDECLRHFISIGSAEPKKGKASFRFRWDPRDLSRIWFLDPSSKRYSVVPYADQSLPTMSVWEYRLVRARLKEQGLPKGSNAVLSRAISELRAQVDESEARTKKARRAAQRRKEHERKAGLGLPEKRQAPPTSARDDLLGEVSDPAWEIE